MPKTDLTNQHVIVMKDFIIAVKRNIVHLATNSVKHVQLLLITVLFVLTDMQAHQLVNGSQSLNQHRLMTSQLDLLN